MFRAASESRFAPCLSRPHRIAWLGCFLALVAVGAPARAADPTAASDPAAIYAAEVRPLVAKHCLACHSTDKKQGELDLERFAAPDDLRSDLEAWRKVAEMLADGQMPPEEEPQPTAAERQRLIDWAKALVDFEIRARAGDPGRVVLRRLSNAEYNYTLRDLTGVDLEPAKEFPADGAAGEGFANAAERAGNVAGPDLQVPGGGQAGRGPSGAAARRVSVFAGDDAPRLDRRGNCQSAARSIGKYTPFTGTAGSKSGPTSRPRCGSARPCWRAASRRANWQQKRGLIRAYLAALWETLSGPQSALPLERIRSRWRAAGPDEAEAIAQEIALWQSALWKFSVIGSYMAPVWQEAVRPKLVESHPIKMRPNLPAGQTHVTLFLVARSLSGPAGQMAVWQRPRIEGGQAPQMLRQIVEADAAGATLKFEPAEAGHFGAGPQGQAIDADSLVVAVPSVVQVRVPVEALRDRDFVVEARLAADAPGTLAAFEVLTNPPNMAQLPPGLPCVASDDLRQAPAETLDPQFDAFRRCFPIYVYYAKIVPDDEIICLRLFFREDEPLGRLFLDDARQRQLDRLWEELRYVSQQPLVEFKNYDTFMGFVSQDGRESYDRVERTTREPVRRRAEQFLAEQPDSWPGQLLKLQEFAERAYRRPLADAERDRLRQLYDRLREGDAA